MSAFPCQARPSVAGKIFYKICSYYSCNLSFDTTPEYFTDFNNKVT